MRYFTEILGHEVEVDFDYRITGRSYPASWDDPGAPMEFEVTSLGEPTFTSAPERTIKLSNRQKLRIIEEIETSSRVYNDILEEGEYNHERDC